MESAWDYIENCPCSQKPHLHNTFASSTEYISFLFVSSVLFWDSVSPLCGPAMALLPLTAFLLSAGIASMHCYMQPLLWRQGLLKARLTPYIGKMTLDPSDSTNQVLGFLACTTILMFSFVLCTFYSTFYQLGVPVWNDDLSVYLPSLWMYI